MALQLIEAQLIEVREEVERQERVVRSCYFSQLRKQEIRSLVLNGPEGSIAKRYEKKQPYQRMYNLLFAEEEQAVEDDYTQNFVYITPLCSSSPVSPSPLSSKVTTTQTPLKSSFRNAYPSICDIVFQKCRYIKFCENVDIFEPCSCCRDTSVAVYYHKETEERLAWWNSVCKNQDVKAEAATSYIQMFGKDSSNQDGSWLSYIEFSDIIYDSTIGRLDIIKIEEQERFSCYVQSTKDASLLLKRTSMFVPPMRESYIVNASHHRKHIISSMFTSAVSVPVSVSS